MGWPILVTALILLAWEISVRTLGIRSIILPPPSAVFAAMAERHDLLLTHLWPSLYLTVLGFGLSVVGGIFVAVLITYSEIVRKGFYPVIVVSQVIPKISIAPLFIVWFGTGTLSSLLLAFLVAFFPVVVNTVVGLKEVEPELLELARINRGSDWDVFKKIRLPNSLPYMFAGIKVAIVLSVTGAIVAEFVAANEGLGYLVLQANYSLDTAFALVILLILAVLSLGLFWLAEILQRKLAPWSAAVREVEGSF